jgi:hypothetical protein
LDRIEAVSPAAKPRLIRPPAISRTASAGLLPGPAAPDAQLFLAHPHVGPRWATAFQNMAEMVSPGSTLGAGLDL